MADTTSKRSVGSPVDKLRSLAGSDVTVTTYDGTVTGSVLSCTRLSVWIIRDDEDFVIPLDEIVDVAVHSREAAA